MAIGADFNADVPLVSGPRFECVATGANNRDFVVSRVDSGFHGDESTNRSCLQYSAGLSKIEKPHGRNPAVGPSVAEKRTCGGSPSRLAVGLEEQRLRH
jgi:hypothetical protein